MILHAVLLDGAGDRKGVEVHRQRLDLLILCQDIEFNDQTKIWKPFLHPSKRLSVSMFMNVWESSR